MIQESERNSPPLAGKFGDEVGFFISSVAIQVSEDAEAR
jgi:hypothetical protein